MFEIKETRRIFEYHELDEKARNTATNELFDLYVNDLGYLNDSIDSAKHACHALKMRVNWAICETFGDAHTYEYIGFDPCSIDAIDVDAISDGEYVGEDIKACFMRHYDALVRANDIVDSIENQYFESMYQAQEISRDFEFVFDTSIDAAIEYECSFFASCGVSKYMDAQGAIKSYKRAMTRAKRLETLVNDASDKFDEMYFRIASEALAIGYSDIAIEYAQYYDNDYYMDAFGIGGYEYDNAPLFDEYGHITQYTMQDIKRIIDSGDFDTFDFFGKVPFEWLIAENARQ